MKLSLLCPHQPTRTDVVGRYGIAASDLGFTGVWTGQSFQIESHMALASIAHLGTNLGIGTALAALRTPYDAALQARSLGLVSGHQVSIAYGAADPGFVTSVRGEPLERPASFMAEYIRIVRGLLRGEIVSSDFPGLHTVDAQLPPSEQKVRLEVGAGVLRPGMAKRSSGVADFVVTWLTPPAYIRDVLLSALDTVIRPRLVSMVHVAVKRPERNAFLLAQIGCANHLKKFHYSDMLNKAGIPNHPSDIAGGARALVDHNVFLYGSVAQVLEGLTAYAEAGVDEVVLNLTAVASLYGDDAATKDLQDLAEAANFPALKLPRNITR